MNSSRPRIAASSVRTIPLVLTFVAAKLLVERLDWEFIEGSPLQATIIAGAVFIVGLMLIGRIHDYNECRRLRTQAAAAIEAIRLEGTYVKRFNPTFDVDRLAGTLGQISGTLGADLLGSRQAATTAVGELTESFLEMDRLGVSPECIVELKRGQALIVANLMRVASIQRMALSPLAYTLVETIFAGLIALLMFSRMTTEATDAIIFGLTSLIFLSVLRLLRAADSSFGVADLDDVPPVRSLETDRPGSSGQIEI